jgi:hypothetical protein
VEEEQRNGMRRIKYIIIHSNFKPWYELENEKDFHYIILNGYDTEKQYETRICDKTKDGKIVQLKEDVEKSFLNSIGYLTLDICLIGNFNQDQPSVKQIGSLHSLLNEKIAQYSILLPKILSHSEALPLILQDDYYFLSEQNRSNRLICPGLFLDMKLIRYKIKNI